MILQSKAESAGRLAPVKLDNGSYAESDAIDVKVFC